MQKRYRAAATALLLTATAGMAATGGAAEASGTHHTSDRAGAKTLTITIKTKAGQIHLSDAKFRPGKTVFKVKPHGKGGDLQVLRLRKGYSVGQAFADVGAAFGGDVKAVRRVDRNIVFYGGTVMAPKGGDPTFWGVKIDKPGTYYVVNVDSNALTTFKVKGTMQKRHLPKPDGWINAVSINNGAGNAFRVGKHNPKSGWMSTANKAKEPHFVDLGHVKKSTTKRQVRKFFMKGAQSAPRFMAKDGAFMSTGIISPGKTFVWSYDLPRGKYLVDCFWPSKADGMPHALMGMWKLTHLG
jgi:hypothetical protein